MSSIKVRLGVLAVSLILLTGSVVWSTAASHAQGAGTVSPANTGGTVADRGFDVFNPVEGRITVVFVRPDGAVVQRGEIVCELSAADFRDRLACQEIACRAAQADLNAAKLNREIAALEAIEYQEAMFVRDVTTAESQVKQAEAKQARAEDRVEWMQRMFDKGYVSVAEKVSEELGLQSARFATEKARTELKSMTEHGKRRMMKLLLAATETAKATELAKEAVLERERLARKKLHEQIDSCKVIAPVNGRVRYVAPMGPGAVVHDGQVLVRIVPDQAARLDSK